MCLRGTAFGIVGAVFSGVALLFVAIAYAPLSDMFYPYETSYLVTYKDELNIAALAMHTIATIMIIVCIVTFAVLLCTKKSNERKCTNIINLVFHIITEICLIIAGSLLTAITIDEINGDGSYYSYYRARHKRASSVGDDELRAHVQVYTTTNIDSRTNYEGLVWTGFVFFSVSFAMAIAVFACVPNNDKPCCGGGSRKRDTMVVPPQSGPPQGYPAQGYPPPQGYQSTQQGYSPQGYPPQGYPPQGYPPQEYPPQGYPPQGYPPQGYPPQGYPPQGYPPQGNPPQTNPPADDPPQGSPSEVKRKSEEKVARQEPPADENQKSSSIGGKSRERKRSSKQQQKPEEK